MTPVHPIPMSGAMRPRTRRSLEGRSYAPFRASLQEAAGEVEVLEPLPASQAPALVDNPVSESVDSSFIALTRSLEQARNARWPSGWLLDILV